MVAFVVLVRIGPAHGFFLDDWDFIAARTAWDVDDLLRPHNEHWSTIPILIYRAWYRLFGLGSYTPYRALSVAAHLAAATAMRLVLRRIGLGPWLASAVVLPWILFGSGWEDILWAFQMAWSGALALALTQLLLADHDGRRDVRDAGGVLAGLAGLAFAGIAVPVSAAVGLSLLLRRGWRVATLHMGPLVVAYGLWNRAYGDTTRLDPWPGRDNLSFLWTSLSAAVSSFSWYSGVGAGVAVLTLALVLWTCRSLGRDEKRQRLAIPVACALGAVAFLYVVGSGRAFSGTTFARASRYQHVATFLLLPLLGAAVLAATEWAARRPNRLAGRGLVAVMLAALWVGVPGNVGQLTDRSAGRLLFSGQLESVQAVAAAVIDRPELPAGAQPLRAAPGVTIGWIREATAEGILTPTRSLTPRSATAVARVLELLLVDERADPATCETMPPTVALEMAPGDTVSFQGLSVSADVVGPTGAYTTTFDLTDGQTLQATEAIEVVLRRPYNGVRICG